MRIALRSPLSTNRVTVRGETARSLAASAIEMGCIVLIFIGFIHVLVGFEMDIGKIRPIKKHVADKQPIHLTDIRTLPVGRGSVCLSGGHRENFAVPFFFFQRSDLSPF
ncbi:hypothetical protein SAMN05421762_0946 [Pseudooceanicola nitratireducens]|uniref:Uncharacterized protein n=1 Tax=Pseudooceanicola nitratireducens TaxID=517719 RepID=A0A1I1J9G1_9RHOB|nr:hypothetical protein SAMN05216183_102942 [Pseudooceanicola nitratireducens]SFC45086.1 hypothetical protein SAMN05421762_0946 [Pseudooceanicola nitratireducens]